MSALGIFLHLEVKRWMSNMIRIKLGIKACWFLPGGLVKHGQGPWQTKLFLFIAVGFSNSEKDDEESQRGNAFCTI